MVLVLMQNQKFMTFTVKIFLGQPSHLLTYVIRKHVLFLKVITPYHVPSKINQHMGVLRNFFPKKSAFFPKKSFFLF